MCWPKSRGKWRTGTWFYIVLFLSKIIYWNGVITIVSEGLQKVFVFHECLLYREGSLSCHTFTLLWIRRDSHQIIFRRTGMLRTVMSRSNIGAIMPCFIIFSNQLLLIFKEYTYSFGQKNTYEWVFTVNFRLNSHILSCNNSIIMCHFRKVL